MPLKSHDLFPVVSQLRYLRLSPTHNSQAEEAMVTDKADDEGQVRYV